MRATTTARVARLRARCGEGCPACRVWPHVWLMGEGDPEPPGSCPGCGRAWRGLVRVYVGVSLGDV